MGSEWREKGVRKNFESVSLHSSCGKYAISTSLLILPGIHKLFLITTSTQ